MALEGIYCPIITPFVDEQIDGAKVAFNLDKLNATDLAGYIVLGSTGEPVHLTRQEKVDTIKVAREYTPADKKLIVGTGLESTRATVELTQCAADLGADYVLVLSPNYYKGDVTAEGFKYHYSTVADKSPVPVLIYNVPRFTGVELPATVVQDLSTHPNIVGLKESTGDLSKLVQSTMGCADEISVLVGNAGLLVSGMMAGAHGAILAICNVVPELCVEIYNLFRQGRIDQAQSELKKMTRILQSGIAQHGIPAIKAAMDMLGFYGGPPRSPLLSVNNEVKNSLRKELALAKLL